MGDRPRIGFLVPTLRVGGAQRVTVTIANGLADRGYDVDLVLCHSVGKLQAEVDDAVTLVDLTAPEIPALGVLGAVPALRAYLGRRTPAVLFSAMTHANVLSVVAGNTSPVETRLVLTEHNTLGMKTGAKSRATTLLARHLYPHADHVVAVSDGVAESVVAETNVGRDDVTTLYNPVPVPEIRHAARSNGVHEWFRSSDLKPLLTVGRLEPPKDVRTLLRAFRRVHDVDPETRLHVVGTGTKRAAWEASAASLGLEDVVSFPGFVENVYAYMGSASAFVLSSRHEGLPTVLIEALACGCPVVSTDCPSGPDEILAGGEFGELVPVGNERALANAILSTLENPPRTEGLVRRAHDFSTENALGAYDSFIHRLLVQRTPPARA